MKEHKIDNNELFLLETGHGSLGDLVNSASRHLQDALVVSKGIVFKYPNDIVVGIQSFSDNPAQIPVGDLSIKIGNVVGATFIKPLENGLSKEDLQNLANSIALHVCGMMPLYINPYTSDEDEDALMTQPFLRINDILVEDLCKAEKIEILEFYRDEINS